MDNFREGNSFFKYHLEIYYTNCDIQEADKVHLMRKLSSSIRFSYIN